MGQEKNCPMPNSVRTAIILLYMICALRFILRMASYFISMVTLQRGGVLNFSLPVLSLAVFKTLIFACFDVFLLSRIGKGLYWGRIVFLAFHAFILPGAIGDIISKISRDGVSGSQMILLLVMEIIALALLFSRSSNSWFREKNGKGESDSGFTDIKG